MVSEILICSSWTPSASLLTKPLQTPQLITTHSAALDHLCCFPLGKPWEFWSSNTKVTSATERFCHCLQLHLCGFCRLPAPGPRIFCSTQGLLSSSSPSGSRFLLVWMCRKAGTLLAARGGSSTKSAFLHYLIAFVASLVFMAFFPTGL